MAKPRRPWRGEDYADKGWTPETTRTCSGECGRTLPATAEYFPLQDDNAFGLRSRCITCKRAADAAWVAANPLRQKASVAAGQLRRRHKHQNHPPEAFPTTYYLEDKLREFLIAEGFNPDNPPLDFLKTEVHNLHRTPIKYGGGPQPENLFWGTRGQNTMMGDKTPAQVVPEIARFVMRMGSEHATALYNQLRAALAAIGAA